MIQETILAVIIAFAISALLCPAVIPFLHKLKFGQQIRQEGQGEPESTAGPAATEHPAPRRRARRVSMAADWVASAAIVVNMFTFLVKIL